MKKCIFGGMAVGLFLLGACGSEDSGTLESGSGSNAGEASGEQVFNFVENAELPTADVALSADSVSSQALNSVYEGLYRVNAEQELEPAGAAEMAEVSEDGLNYTIHLNEKAVWSNGEPVTAADYVYGWQRTADPDTAAEYAYFFEKLANGAAVIAGDKAPSELGVKAVGDYELEVTLAQATPYFEYLLAFVNFFPQHQATVEEFGADYAITSENAVYNGPFMLADFDGPGIDTDWAYVKNDRYWDAENVQLDRINVTVVKESATALNLFQDGQVDDVTLSGELAQQMAADPEFITEKQGATFYIEFNYIEEDSPYHNENLRKAISCAIDREAYVKNIIANGSVAAYGVVPTDLTFAADGEDFAEQATVRAEYDVDQAAVYWEKAKKELGIDSLDVEILADDTESGKKTAEYLQGVFEEALPGMSVKVSNVPFAVRLERSNKGEFDMVMSGWAADYADPSSFLDLFVTGNAYNRGKWSNEKYDSLIEESITKNANDAQARWQNLLDAENMLLEQAVVVPTYQKAEAHMRSSKAKGMVTHASGVKRDFKWMYIEE